MEGKFIHLYDAVYLQALEHVGEEHGLIWAHMQLQFSQTLDMQSSKQLN